MAAPHDPAGRDHEREGGPTPELTVVVLTKNEERNVGALFDSIIPLRPARTLLLDSGSTDRTCEIARAYGVEVQHQDWLGYREQRNVAHRQVTTPWVLFLDADERLTPGLREDIRAAIRDEREPYLGYRLKRDNYYLGKSLRCWYPDAILRLAKTSASRWVGGHVHEIMEVDGPVGMLRRPMLHDSFRDLEDHHLKRTRYARLMALSKHDRGKRFRFWMLIRPIFSMFKYLFWMGGIFEGRRAWIYAISYTIYAMQKVLFLAELSLADEVAASDFPYRDPADTPAEPLLAPLPTEAGDPESTAENPADAT